MLYKIKYIISFLIGVPEVGFPLKIELLVLFKIVVMVNLIT